MQHPDICIAGAGIIGLSLALELHRRGATVTVMERDAALSHASTAAAGMLAAHDPENPSQLLPLSSLSIDLYPAFLERIEFLSGFAVPFQTSRTLQAHHAYTTSSELLIPELQPGAHHFRSIAEHSIDPRQLAAALLSAVRCTSVHLLEHTTLEDVAESSEGLRIQTSTGIMAASQFVSTLGAWSTGPVAPRKGQMLTIELPSSFALKDVLRTPDVYIVPRTTGPRAGRALLGATVEEAGYDTATHAIDLARLRSAAAELLPMLADETLFPAIDQWAGLRPATPDLLPILDRVPGTLRQYIATGHYRNGILLAPATAHVIAQLLQDETTSVSLSAFCAARFTAGENIAGENIAHKHRYSPTLS